MQVHDRPMRQDTFDLRDQIHSDDHGNLDSTNYNSTSDEEHSVLEDDSDGEEMEYMDDDEDDGSSSLSIPNESIDFDLVYSLHSFAATVEGQANVVKGDSLFLMDDSNSYWWLVRVLKTQEVGYIPAENIETPFERLARLNKHRNVDLASATQAELQEDVHASRDRLRNNLSSRAGSHTPSPSPGPRTDSRITRSRQSKSVAFTKALYVHRYPPAVWGEEEEEDDDAEWDDEPYEDEDPDLAEEQYQREQLAIHAASMEPDDEMGWDDSAALEMQAQAAAARAASSAELQEQQALRDKLEQQQKDLLAQQEAARVQVEQQAPSSAPSAPTLDPVQATETRKVTATPSIIKEEEAAQNVNPILPDTNLQTQEEERKRARDEAEALEEAARKKVKANTVVKPNGGAKLHKERERDTDDESGKERRGKGLFSGLFRKKEKGVKDKHSSGEELSRSSEESGRSSSHHSSNAPESIMIPQQQIRNPPDAKDQQAPSTPPQVSLHASTLRQRDQQQRELYQQYLNRSPSSPPEERLLSTAAGSASGLGLALPTSRPRPVSLVLTPSGDGPAVGVPELSVIRVFAGQNLQTEATFKTVLLNTSTTSQDLVRQAIQRFRLPTGEDASDYYLTVKQVEGSSAVLRPNENPLKVFETLVEEALELPKVKRSSVGSISSVASNLSMHPAIKKLPMNDFTDDSAVKFYLNRRGEPNDQGQPYGEEGDETLMAESSFAESESQSTRQQFLSVSTSNNVTPERFSSPSFRFALQLLISPDDLPDDMVFDPMTEAIVFRNTLRDRPNQHASSTVSQSSRRKVFVFPKNVTVAEVIELGLERFGIPEGVVDGGDEVEDKLTKRRSSSRVRYGLVVSYGNQERELSPSSKVIDAYPRPPTLRAVERRFPDSKRRSVDSTMLLGSQDDVHPEDPIFILRRAISYRNSSSRHRTSAPLDEIALQHLHREHRESASNSSVNSDGVEDPKHRQMSRQELIAAQRAATRANQRAIITAQTNSVRGVDVLLPGNAMIRSSRYDAGDKMRYSYVEPDGETYDISDIVEEEWRENNANRNDLLESVVSRNKDVLGEKIDRVLNKIKDGKANNERGTLSQGLPKSLDSFSSTRSASPSVYSLADQDPSRSATPVSTSARTPTPTSTTFASASQRMVSPSDTKPSRSRTATPTAAQVPAKNGSNRRQPSIASVMSDLSGYATPTAQMNASPSGSPRSAETPRPQRRRPLIPKDEFGVSHMMTIIELGSLIPKVPLAPLHPVDDLLFGREIDDQSLHPQVREIYSDAFRQLRDMDKALDDFLQTSRQPS